MSDYDPTWDAETKKAWVQQKMAEHRAALTPAARLQRQLGRELALYKGAAELAFLGTKEEFEAAWPEMEQQWKVERSSRGAQQTPPLALL
jgi:hypothetical protein